MLSEITNALALERLVWQGIAAGSPCEWLLQAAQATHSCQAPTIKLGMQQSPNMAMQSCSQQQRGSETAEQQSATAAVAKGAPVHAGYKMNGIGPTLQL